MRLMKFRLSISAIIVPAPSGALSQVTAELRHALQDVGFYFVINHGVPELLIAGAFDAARRFHDQPEETKLALRINQHNIGYLPFKSSVTRHSKLNDNNRPNLVEAFFTKRETPEDAQVQPFRAPNRWPDDLPGFRDAVLAYQYAMEALGKSLLPLYAAALDLPPDWFNEAFAEPMFTLRLAHYPRQDVVEENEFGLAPHSDTSFMTLLAQNDIPGLSIRLPNGRWLDAPSLPGSIWSMAETCCGAGRMTGSLRLPIASSIARARIAMPSRSSWIAVTIGGWNACRPARGLTTRRSMNR